MSKGSDFVVCVRQLWDEVCGIHSTKGERKETCSGLGLGHEAHKLGSLMVLFRQYNVAWDHFPRKTFCFKENYSTEYVLKPCKFSIKIGVAWNVFGGNTSDLYIHSHLRG